MTDYKATLNLPHTDFPMKGNLPQREPQRLAWWREHDIAAALADARRDAPRFILHDGPPYANGRIHIGHALNKVLKDMVLKSKALSGFAVPYVPGWDCHGLPIEIKVEQKFGKVGEKMSAAAFRQHCRDYATSQWSQQRDDFERLGVIGDWDAPYKTMDFTYEAAVIRALADLFERGYVQPGYKPVYWCCDCRSALAEAEVEYLDKTSQAIDVAFMAADRVACANRLGVSAEDAAVCFPIWTTTPWTLPANRAVAVGADVTYAVVACQAPLVQADVEVKVAVPYLVVAEEQLVAVMAQYGCADYTVQQRILGQELEGLRLQHPFYNETVPVVLSEFVTTDAGTGLVHTAPAHGPEDYLVCQRYPDIEVVNPVLENGCYAPDTPLFAGLHVREADAAVIAVLQQRQTLLHHATIQHSYPHCWRHKTPVIFRATPQWFIRLDADGLREQALAAIRQVTWSPTWGEERLAGMVAQRGDWCISRQRSWGTPICLFIHRETGQPHPRAAQLMRQVAAVVAERGIDAWFDTQLKRGWVMSRSLPRR